MCGARVLVSLLLLLGRTLALHKQFAVTIGYLPSIKGELRDRQGLAISGAISLALTQINNSTDILPDVKLKLEWNDTECDTVIATRLLTKMAEQGVAAFFGPEGRCQTEATIAQGRNLPMITYKCSDYKSGSLRNVVRLEPAGAQATKALISLMRYYRWNKFSILAEEPWDTVALAMELHAKRNNMTVTHLRTVIDIYKCCKEKLSCCAPGSSYQFIHDTMNKTRIYVFLGSTAGLLDMMEAMDSLQLFQHGQYMVLYVDTMTYSPDESLKYLIKTEDRGNEAVCPHTPEFRRKARSLLVVAVSEPEGSYESFTHQVREYNTLEPFKFPLPKLFENNFNKYVSIYAAYLYDSVKLYAKALDTLIREETRSDKLTSEKLRNIAYNGSRIIQTMIESTKVIGNPFKSIAGTTIRLDKFGNSEGNFIVLSFKPAAASAVSEDLSANCNYTMVPVGHFYQSVRVFPDYRLNPRQPIDWPDSVKPADEPTCGFSNEKCPN